MIVPVYKLDDKKKRVYYTYVLRLGNGRYYVGQTANLSKRFREHENALGARGTRKNPPKDIAYYETHLTREQAAKREKELKSLLPQEKETIFSNKKGAYKMLKRKKKRNPARKTTKKRRSTAKRRRAVPARRRRSAVARRRPTIARRRRRNAPYRATRRNPGYSYKRKRRTYRRRSNPSKMFGFLNQRFLVRSASVAGGVAGGYIAMPLWVMMLPSGLTQTNRRFYGLLNVMLGGLVMSFSKRRAGRDIGTAIAGTGVYDLIAKMLPDLGLPALPGSSPLLEGLTPKGDEEPVSANYRRRALGATYSARRAPSRALSANYRPTARMGANYNAVSTLFGSNGTPDGGL